MNAPKTHAPPHLGRWSIAAAVALALAAGVGLSRVVRPVEAQQVGTAPYPGAMKPQGVPGPLPPPPPRFGLIRAGSYYLNMDQIQYVLVESDRPNAERVRVQFLAGGGQLMMAGPNARGLIDVLGGLETAMPDDPQLREPGLEFSRPDALRKSEPPQPPGSEVEAELIPPPEDVEKDYQRETSPPPPIEVPKSR